jgi:hypothetical protein
MYIYVWMSYVRMNIHEENACFPDQQIAYVIQAKVTEAYQKFLVYVLEPIGINPALLQSPIVVIVHFKKVSIRKIIFLEFFLASQSYIWRKRPTIY